MGKGGGGSADQSGMYAAMAAENAANLEYKLGQEQLDWAKQVWGQEQPLVTQAEQIQMQAATADIAAQQQAQQFAQEQEQTYNQYFLPMEKQYAGQAANWASPDNMALYTGEAQNNVAEQMGNSLNTAKEQLQAYGVNPDAPRFAGLYVGQNALSGAAQAGAGTSAAQNLRLQQMGLEGNAINVGMGVGQQSANLTGVGTGAGSGATQGGAGAAATGQSNLSTGSNAMVAPTAYFNSAANNMNVYTNAVGQYNQAKLGYADLAAKEAGGAGSLVSGIFGDLTSGGMGGFGSSMLGAMFAGLRRGGPVMGYEDGAGVEGPDPGMMEQMASPSGQDDQSYQPAPEPPPQQVIPPVRMQPTPPPIQQSTQTTGIPPTPGGRVPEAVSPSGGQQTDDVPSMLTAGEFVMPYDVSQHIGHKALTGMIDKARQEMAQTDQRGDIGGEPVAGIPPAPPKFISRPMHTGSTAMLPMQGLSGIPPQRQQAQA